MKQPLKHLEGKGQIITACALLAMSLLPMDAFCDDTLTTIDTLTDNTINTIFSPWIRKAALAFGGGFGLFQAYMGGSVRPLLTWGGLGLAVNYVPKLIDVISKVGA